MRLLRALIVEDNDADAELICRTLEKEHGFLDITVTIDGVEALEYLQTCLPGGERPRPDLILLDLNLPRLDGPGVLLKIREIPEFAVIPVVMLTSSDAEADVRRCYERGANCYVLKPIGLKSYREAIRAIERFWTQTVLLP
ncbi:response regulator [Novosphingobium aquimarinum]|uniref:response regulator n=1 Tax=Novosphingobium aquimarinum TaxID=2682494 RepID=UPI0012EBEB9A|nr:response regulator [Novosphingobium aquimarinum]